MSSEAGGGRGRRLQQAGTKLRILRSRIPPSEILAVLTSQTYIVTEDVLEQHRETRILLKEAKARRRLAQAKADKPTKSPTLPQSARPSKSPRTERPTKSPRTEKPTRSPRIYREKRNKTLSLKVPKNKTRESRTPRKPFPNEDADDEEDEYTEYIPEYKFPVSILNDSNVLVMTLSPQSYYGGFVHSGCDARPLDFGLYQVKCTRNATLDLAHRDDVLSIGGDYALERNTVPMSTHPTNRSQLETNAARDLPRIPRDIVLLPGQNPGFGTGAGEVLIKSDADLDVYHHAFYDPNGIVPFGTVNLEMHNKIVGILNADATGYSAVPNAHGTGTSSNAVGNRFGDTIGGVAHGSRLCFIDMTAPGSTSLQIPTGYFSTLESLHTTYGFKINSMSWQQVGGYGERGHLSYLVDLLNFRNRWFTNTASAGNRYGGVIRGEYPASQGVSADPATAKSVLSVGANLFDSLYQAGFSSTGLTVDGRRVPILSAPGVGIIAAVAVSYPDPGHTRYDLWDGTSLSVDVIAGLKLLFQEKYKNLNGGMGITDAAFCAILLAHVTAPLYVTSDSTGTVTIAGVPLTSYGTPQIVESQIFFKDNVRLETDDTIWEQCWRVPTPPASGAREYNLVLSWTDQPGLPGVYPSLVNDLDAVFISDVQTEWMEDNVNSRELWFEFRARSFIRTMVYAFEARVTSGPVYFALAMKTPAFGVGETVALVETACGTDHCFPGDTVPCDPDEFGKERICHVNGSYSMCVTREIEVIGWNQTCSLANAVEAKMVDGVCSAILCEEYYSIQEDHTCACLADTYKDCGGGRIYVPCNAGTGDFDSCDSKQAKSVKTPVSVESDSTSYHQTIPSFCLIFAALILS